MKTHRCWPIVCAGVFIMFASLRSEPDHPAASPPQSYGSIAVTRVIRVDDTACTVFCDIDAFPPVVGKAIAVQLEGIEMPADGTVNRDVVAFLRQVLKPDAKPDTEDEVPSIVLHNIQRGTTFSLVADIEVDGNDLAQMLVDNGLARRIIRVEADPAAVAKAESSEHTESKKELQFVASRTSRVFHRSTCPHARRIDPARVVTFETRRQAEENGRRPCNTCNP